MLCRCLLLSHSTLDKNAHCCSWHPVSVRSEQILWSYLCVNLFLFVLFQSANSLMSKTDTSRLLCWASAGLFCHLLLCWSPILCFKTCRLYWRNRKRDLIMASNNSFQKAPFSVNKQQLSVDGGQKVRQKRCYQMYSLIVDIIIGIAFVGDGWKSLNSS